MRSSGSYFPPDPSPGAKFREFPKAIEEEGHSCQSPGSAPATAKCVEVVTAVLPRPRAGVELTSEVTQRGGYPDKCTQNLRSGLSDPDAKAP